MLASFGGGRVIVGVTSTPFKCPPAPSETALLMHDFLAERGLRERSEIVAGHAARRCRSRRRPTASRGAARGVRRAGHRAGIRSGSVRALDPARKVRVLADGGEMPYDLFLGVPVHRAPAVVVRQSGLTVDGWIPVDPLTLETPFPGVYAVGDVDERRHAQGRRVRRGAGRDRRRWRIDSPCIRGDVPARPTTGAGICYLEFGHDQVAKVDVTFRERGAAPPGARGPVALSSPPTRRVRLEPRPALVRALEGAGRQVEHVVTALVSTSIRVKQWAVLRGVAHPVERELGVAMVFMSRSAVGRAVVVNVDAGAVCWSWSSTSHKWRSADRRWRRRRRRCSSWAGRSPWCMTR